MAPAYVYALSLLFTILLTSIRTSSAAAPPPHRPDYKIYIVLLKPRADGAHLSMDDDARRDWHMSFLPSAVTHDGKPRLITSYDTLFQGFAARLTKEELEAVSRKPGFGRWFPDGIMYPDTTHTPEFLDLTPDAGHIWDNSSYGKGVIIGIMDSGVNSNHPSFDDYGMPLSPPAKWKGTCDTTGGFRCNNKIIGARSFTDDHPGPNDVNGHGTHVASTAAGNFVANASDFNGGQAAGTASGIAPYAHLAIYRICYSTGCPYWAILKGFAAAVSDGVDIISISLNHADPAKKLPYYEDPLTVAAFRAVAMGVLVVSSAGNEGPARSTVGNDAPWHFTVGAGSIDRRIVGDMVLGNGDLVEGEALVQGVNSTTEYHPLHCPSKGSRHCYLVSDDNVRGHIVVCDETSPFVVQDLYRRDAAQVVIVHTEDEGYTLPLIDYVPGESVVQVPFAFGQKIRDYCLFPEAEAKVSFTGTMVNIGGAPMVASLSSRGPSSNNPFIIKPDILAPGLNILAANGMDLDKPFKFESGTSMAAPHVSGVAALLKSLHPEWSPAYIRSAIMTSATDLDNAGNYILDEQRNRASVYDMGAGHIAPQSAVNPGLVYDMDARDYAAFVCNIFAPQCPHDDVQDLIGDLRLNCETLPAGVRDIDLNYPTLVVPANTTVRRTLTKVGPGPRGETYESRVIMRDDKVKVNVSPSNLTFDDPGASHNFQVSADYQGKNTSVEGTLDWQSDYHTVSSRIVVFI